VRLSIDNLETLKASAIRRALRRGETEAVPRISDLASLIQSSRGKVEFEVFEEGREQELLERLLSQAVLEVFRQRLIGYDFRELLDLFDSGLSVETGDLVSSKALLTQGAGVDVSGLLIRLALSGESPGDAAAALEFTMEGLHLTRRLNKEGRPGEGGVRYGG
jgi:magnesium chelatase subunit I